MTYEELVKKVKKVVEKIDKGAVKEHTAIEIDIEGEGEGAFYVELDKDSSEIFFHLMLQLYKLSMGRFCLGCLFVNLALLYGI